MVRQLIEETGALDQLRPDDLVMIKPNLVESRENWLGVDTDPRVIEALVKVLKDGGVHRSPLGMAAGWETAPQRHLSTAGTGIWPNVMDYGWLISIRMNSSRNR